MAADKYYSAIYVSEKLGSSLTAVHNWREKPDNGFPEPAVSIHGVTGSRPTCGWSREQIAEMRAWYAERFRLSDENAAQRWKSIDEGTFKVKSTKPPHEGQLSLAIPVQRISVEDAA